MIAKLLQFLNKPYPFVYTKKSIVFHSAGAGAFIFLFLFIFQPFDSYPSHESLVDKFLIYFGYGLITLIVTGSFYIVLNKVIPDIIAQEQVKFKYELLFSAILLVLIGVGNAVYHHTLFPDTSFLAALILFQYYTFVVGIFPVTILLMIDIIVRMSTNLRNAVKINSSLSKSAQGQKGLSQEVLVLLADNEKEKVTVHPDHLLYIKAAGNYVEIFSINNDQIISDILRSPIKGMESQLEKYPNIFRCHRAYLVNLLQIESVAGDSQGYQISLKNTTALVPVSRTYLKAFKSRVSGI